MGKRNGPSKMVTPASTGIPPEVHSHPARARLPETRQGVTRRFHIPIPAEEASCPKCGEKITVHPADALKLYVSVGMYEDGRPGEVFCKADKAGSFASGALDGFAIAMSLGLQYGVPLKAYTDKLVAMKFEPAGLTGDAQYPIAKSVLDLVGRWLRDKFEEKKKEEKP